MKFLVECLLVDSQQLVATVMMFGSELHGSQSKMRNTFKLCTLIIKHGEDLLVSQEEVCVVVQMLLFSRSEFLPQGLFLRAIPGDFNFRDLSPFSREASGLVLLSSCPRTASRLQKFFTHSQRARRPTATYW